MEDVLVLTEMMFEKYPNDRLKAFEEYSKHRNPDAEAMCDLAMYNYIEVRKKSSLLKVSKFQKQILLFSFKPKNKLNYFLISALRI